MEVFGIFSGIIGVAVIVLGILALLMPFFIMQIRDAVKRMDNKMDRIISLLFGGQQSGPAPYTPIVSAIRRLA